MKNYEYMRVPKELADKLKGLEDTNKIYEDEVLKYVKKTKLDISGSVENLDEDILMFKAKLTSYKKAFKETYEAADEEMYSFWEEMDKKIGERHKRMATRLERLNKLYMEDFQAKQRHIKDLRKSLENINTYEFDKIISFLKSYQSLNEDTKQLFCGMIKTKDKK